MSSAQDQTRSAVQDDTLYGSIPNNTNLQRRRMRVVAVSLSIAAVATLCFAWPRHGNRISAFQLPSPKNWSDFEGTNSASAYINGEKNVLDLFLKETESTNTMVDRAYDVARQRLVKRLEAELERHFELELQKAMKERHEEKARSQVGSELGALGKSISSQQTTVQGLNAIGTKIRALEQQVCSGQPCEEVPALLSKERGRWTGKEKEYTKEISALRQASKEWEAKARMYEAMLHGPPPPPRCEGLKQLVGATGNLTTGVSENGEAGSIVEDCRWIIRAPPGKSTITLQFTHVHIVGSKSRVSIYVGPENVALYKNEDVVNWSSAFRSFTGSAFPLPVECNSNEVLIIFHAEPKSHGRPEASSFDMSWTTGTGEQARAA